MTVLPAPDILSWLEFLFLNVQFGGLMAPNTIQTLFNENTFNIQYLAYLTPQLSFPLTLTTQF